MRKKSLSLTPLLVATALVLPTGIALAQTVYVTPGYVAAPVYAAPVSGFVVPLATVAPVPRIDYVAPPGVAIYDVQTTYGGTVTMAAPGW
jgi:hypothetical protein